MTFVKVVDAELHIAGSGPRAPVWRSRIRSRALAADEGSHWSVLTVSSIDKICPNAEEIIVLQLPRYEVVWLSALDVTPRQSSTSMSTSLGSSHRRRH